MDAGDPVDEQTLAFREPERFLAALDARSTAQIIASAADVALIVEEGVIQDVALGTEELVLEGRDRSWRDKPWVETVTIESRPKIETLLDPSRAAAPRWRQVNHPSADGTDLPVDYTVVPLGGPGRVVALGRDLRSTARLQQRLVEAHQELERDYARLREAESRYRLLFQSVSQPVLIVDPSSMVIEEANPAAAAALGEPVQSLVGSSADAAFARGSQSSVARVVAEAMSMGAASTSNATLRNGHSCGLEASAFRYEQSARVIVRLETRASEPGSDASLASLAMLEDLPDGLVVADPDLRILAANRAFVDMTRMVHRGQVVGGRLSDYLGRSGTELNVLVSNLRNHGLVRNFNTVLRDRFGSEEAVEVSAVTTPSGSTASYGFSVRGVARRLRAGRGAGESLPGSNERLADLVGRVPLKEIVRESTDFIEKLCIEAALEVTGDNRASAAEMLGLSRQGLYSKLKRFGIDD